MTKGYTYLTVFSPNELWGADKPEFYHIILRKRTSDIDAKADAKRRLELYKQFDPSISHNRTVAQKVTINFVKHPVWTGHGKLIVANENLAREDKGLEKKLEIDFGKLAEQISTGKKPENIPYCDVSYRPEYFNSNKLVTLEFKFLPCLHKMPIIFSVLEYIAFDNQIIQQNRRLYRPKFKQHTFVSYLDTADN